jgi:hypothetical protein
MREESTNSNLPPNVRYWFKQIAESIEKQWQKTTEGWPEPMFPWRGELEKVQGQLVQDGIVHEGQVFLWHKRRVAPDDTSSWGGIVTFEEQDLGVALRVMNAVNLHLGIPGRRKAPIMAVQTDGGRVVFVGNGPYPAL